MVKKTLGLVFIFVFLAMPAFAEPISQEILDQARAQAGLFMDLKNALGLDWLDEYNAYLDNPTSSPEPSWASSVAELVGKNYLSDAFPDDFSITPSGQEVTISRTITSQGIKDALPIYLPSVAISGDTASLLVQRPVQWVSWEAALASKVSRAGDDDPDILPGASLEFGSGSEIEFTSGDGKLVGISSLSYKGEELEDRFVNAAGDNMTGPLTIEGNKVWHAGNDGSGSGLDADLLDGQHGSYYLAAGNLTGIVPVARLSGTYNIDISGRASVASEADNADLLDGKHASAFALAHSHPYVNKGGDTMTGVLTMSSGKYIVSPEYRINDGNTRIYEGSSNQVRIQTNSGYVDIGPANTGWAHFQTDRDKFYFNKPVNAVDELKVYNSSTYLTGSTGYIDGKRILTTDDLSSSNSATWDVILENRTPSGSWDSGSQTSIGGSWRIRGLNTIVYNNGPLVSLSSNQFTLRPGKYIIDWDAPAFDIYQHKSRLRNVSTGSVVAYGSTEYNSKADVTTRSMGTTVVTISSNNAFRIEHIVGRDRGLEGWGRPAYNGTEVRTRVRIKKIG